MDVYCGTASCLLWYKSWGKLHWLDKIFILFKIKSTTQSVQKAKGSEGISKVNLYRHHVTVACYDNFELLL